MWLATHYRSEADMSPLFNPFFNDVFETDHEHEDRAHWRNILGQEYCALISAYINYFRRANITNTIGANVGPHGMAGVTWMTPASRAHLLELPQDAVLYIHMENVLNSWGRGNVAEAARRNGRIILPSASNHQRAGFVPMADVVRRREMRGTTTREGGRKASREMETSAWNENDIAGDSPQLTEDGFPPSEITPFCLYQYEYCKRLLSNRLFYKIVGS
jgi:hypothetical protein